MRRAIFTTMTMVEVWGLNFERDIRDRIREKTTGERVTEPDLGCIMGYISPVIAVPVRSKTGSFGGRIYLGGGLCRPCRLMCN